MSVFSVNGANNSGIYSMFFNTGSGNNGAAAGIFSGGSTAISDMALIKSGAYKKLLNSYYASQGIDKKGNSVSSSTNKTSTATDSTGKLQAASSDASSLVESLKELGNRSLYQGKTGEDGKTVYDTDKITSAVKDFVSSYNSYIDSTGNLDSTSLLSKTLDVVSTSKRNAGLLKDIGISIGSDNKLNLDEEKLKKADVSTINSLFAGSGSYGSNVSAKASATSRIASSTAYTNKHASTYTFNGGYSMTNTVNNALFNQYL